MPTTRPAYITEAHAYRIYTKDLWTGEEVESGALYREQRYLGFSTFLGWNDVWVLWGDSFHRQSDGYETRIEPTTTPSSMRSFLEGQVGHPGNVVTTWARSRAL
jgi:hypothetical protein